MTYEKNADKIEYKMVLESLKKEFINLNITSQLNNKKMIFHMLGRIVTLQAVLMALPLICGIIYMEKSVASFFILSSALLVRFESQCTVCVSSFRI